MIPSKNMKQSMRSQLGFHIGKGMDILGGKLGQFGGEVGLFGGEASPAPPSLDETLEVHNDGQRRGVKK